MSRQAKFQFQFQFMLCQVTLCLLYHAMLCQVMLCLLFHAMLCQVMLCLLLTLIVHSCIYCHACIINLCEVFVNLLRFVIKSHCGSPNYHSPRMVDFVTGSEGEPENNQLETVD